MRSINGIANAQINALSWDNQQLKDKYVYSTGFKKTTVKLRHLISSSCVSEDLRDINQSLGERGFLPLTRGKVLDDTSLIREALSRLEKG